MKTINFLENAANLASKFRIKNRVEIRHDSLGTYNTNSQTKCKTAMLK